MEQKFAPGGHVKLELGGGDYDLVGASVTTPVYMHGHFHFHYDEKLGRINGPIRYRVASWDEL